MKEDIYCYSCMERLPEDAADCPVCGQEVHYKNAPHQLPAGTILADRYLVGRVLGEGGFGITYIGRDLRLDMKVAVKEYYPAGTVNRHYLDSLSLSVSREDQKELFEQGREKFLQEARTLAKFSAEPSIVCVRDFFTENGTAYIVMEFLEGKSLQQYLAEHGRLSFDRAYEMLEPVLSALDKVHAMGLIHRDISPSNLMLLNNGRVKLLDFGTARNVSYFGENSLSVVYKPGFAPEEQYRSHSAQGPWTDVYAMCATIYKLITGNAPENAMNRMFEDTLTPPSECGAEILPAQERVLLKGMAVRREDRIQSMQELREAFAQSAVEKESVAVAEPDEEDEERTVAGPSLMERKRRTPESEPAVSSELRRPERNPEPLSKRRESEGKPAASSEQSIGKKVRRSDDSAAGAAQKRKKEESLPHKKRKSHKMKRMLLIAVPCVLLVLVLGIFAFQNLSESPYKSGSYANISSETVEKGMLRKIAADQEIERLIFYNCEISDEMIQQIAKMSRITQIELKNCYGFSTLEPLSALEALKYLSISSSQSEVQTLDGNEMFPVSFASVTTLSLSGWELSGGTSFLENFPAAESVYIRYCSGIDDLSALAGCSDLTSLCFTESSLEGVDLSVLSGCTGLSSFEAENCGLDTIDWMGGFEGLTSVLVSDNQISSLESLSSSYQLKYLDVENNLLQDLTGLENHSALLQIYANGNQLTDISALKSSTALTQAELADNQITDISALSDCYDFLNLDLSGNQITDITALNGNTELKTLDLRDNQITDISALIDCAAITTLYLTSNQLTSLDGCEQMIDLEKLYASNNQIADINGLTNVTQLEDVRMFHNQITDISVLSKSSDHLVTVLLGDNQIADISALSGAAGLYSLGIENNLLTSLDALSGCGSLYYLSAYGNQITDISGIAGCTSLYFIDLGENEITDISPLASISVAKQVLLLQNNNISDITSLRADCDYIGLSLYNNPITDFSVIGAMTNVSSKDILYVSYDEDWDYSLIAMSPYKSAIHVVEAPLDQQAEIKNIQEEVKQNSYYMPEFLTEEEADAEIADYRNQIAEKTGVNMAREEE